MDFRVTHSCDITRHLLAQIAILCALAAILLMHDTGPKVIKQAHAVSARSSGVVQTIAGPENPVYDQLKMLAFDHGGDPVTVQDIGSRMETFFRELSGFCDVLSFKIPSDPALQGDIGPQSTWKGPNGDNVKGATGNSGNCNKGCNCCSAAWCPGYCKYGYKQVGSSTCLSTFRCKNSSGK